ncbi:MAG TPA: hypothetical protein VII35_16455 [Steroidobacteraceae bacterium]
MDDDDAALAKYNSVLRREEIHYETTMRREEMPWQGQLDRIRHFDRAAIDIGLTAVQSGILANAGALVALLAFTGQIWEKDPNHIIVHRLVTVSAPFVRGLICGLATTIVAYIYQSVMTAWAANELKKMSKAEFSKFGFRWVARPMAVVMLALACGSFWGFILGVLKLPSVLR